MPDAIDNVITLGSDFPMGSLAMADHIGVDTCLDILEALYKVLGDSKYRFPPLLRKPIDAGYL